jgi:aspartyl-tRNA(Asn)/glutamyl-tRNA(Gln) amidotransferase subunit C
MKIDRDTVNRVAALAKLQFTEEEKTQLEEDMTKIVTYFEKMNELDTEGVEPLVFLTDEINAFREDEAQITITHEEALKNAPERNSDYFKVPKFLEKES